MGATVSRSSGIENPFPVGSSLSKDLDLLTTVAVRLLSSSDIYDITNLENPGVCGSYAVFIKKNIEKRLLSFVADLSGGPVEVLYQNPSKQISAATRREICRLLAETMVTLVATVVALLASIQVKSDSRSAAARAAIPSAVVQRGGADIADVTDWLLANGYIRTAPASRPSDEFITYELYNAEMARYGNAPKFTLRLNRRISRNYTFNGTLAATGGEGFPKGVPERLEFPNGTLDVQVMLPVKIPNTLREEESILPFRLSDKSNLPWMAGALYKSLFLTAAPAPSVTDAMNPFEMWADIFRLTQNIDLFEGRESRGNINRAAEVLNQYMRTNNPQILLQALAPYLVRLVGYNPGAAAAVYPAAPLPGYPPVPYPGAPAYMPPPTYGYVPPVAAAPTGFRPPALVGASTTAVAAAGATYDISRPSTSVILDTLRNYRKLIPDESSPAAVRAFTLAGKVNPDRTINTDVCNDPYWRLGGLHLIYPWATLQFLCVNNWEKLGTSAGKDVFHDTWATFLEKLRTIYPNADGKGLPKITGPADTQVLRGFTFTTPTDVAVCKGTTAPRVRFNRIQAGLLTLQGRYERHVRSVWEILNALIVVIVDPETREQTVRLHPKVYSADSNAYVNARAEEARKLLMDFYIGVEEDYTKTVKDLTVVD
jgi:hypothetical protein